MIEALDQQVYDQKCPLLVKIYARSLAGEPAGESTGFLYSPASDVMVTTSAIGSPSGDDASGSGPRPEVVTAVYTDGFEEQVELLSIAVNHLPAVAILRGSRCAPRTLLGNMWGMGVAVYALGFSPGSNTPCFRKGAVSCAMVGRVTVTADRTWTMATVAGRL